jgi:Zn finger protein HypA/HybF involved in hydrogenase expression
MSKEYEYYCRSCEEDFVSTEQENLCTQCLGENIILSN